MTSVRGGIAAIDRKGEKISAPYFYEQVSITLAIFVDESGSGVFSSRRYRCFKATYSYLTSSCLELFKRDR
ncbi:MAG: hypothetical protein AAGL17_06475 [Cyanobacteria bacterium J06576_12]